ncbi:hypothetical protein GCM10009712_10850 [Pseudarthrobacter sulfonivorans]
MENLCPDIRVAEVLAYLPEAREAGRAVDDEFGAAPAIPSVVSSQAEFERGGASLKIPAVPSNAIPSGLFDGSSRERQGFVAAPQCMSVLWCDHARSVNFWVSKAGQCGGESGQPSAVPVSVADAVQKEQEGFLGHWSSDQN